MRRNRRNRVQDGEKGGWRREKENSWERWTSRQIDSPERQAPQPPPHTHQAPQTPACGSWALICRDGQRQTPA